METLNTIAAGRIGRAARVKIPRVKLARMKLARRVKRHSS
jgi:hypothetical protein|tara:strand:+ start:72 stop:191 length:120 start_codon:yes stop_codon:yes gene_type:complete